MKKLLLINFLCVSFVCFSQKNNFDNLIDSLQNELKTNDIKKKIVLYDELAWQLRNNNAIKAIEYAKKGLEISTEENEHKKIGLYNTLGLINANNNNIDEAMSNYEKSIAICEKLNRKNNIASIYANIGTLFWNLDKYKKAVTYYNLAEKNVSIKEDFIVAKSMLHSIAINRANVYLELNYYTKALKEYIKAEKFSKKYNLKDNLSVLYTNIGNLYAKINNYKEALSYYKKALIFDKKLNNTKEIANSYSQIGTAYKNLSKLDSAYHYLSKGIEFSKKAPYKSSLSFAYYAMGSFYKELLDYKKCIKFSKFSLNYSNPKNDIDDIIRNNINIAESYLNLNNVSKSNKYLKDAYKFTNNKMLNFRQNIFSLYVLNSYYQKDIKKATEYKQKYDSIVELINRSETIRAVEELQTQQKENQILKQQNELQEKEINLQKQRQKTYFYSFLAIVLIVVGGGYVFKLKRDNKVSLLKNSIKISEEEKTRIGRDLHDGIASNLLQLVQEAEKSNIALSHKLLASYNDIRGLSHQLNNTPIHGEVFADRVFELIPENNNTKQYKLHISPHYLELKEPLGTHLYRIVQELITNDSKHAKSDKVFIDIVEKENSLAIAYKDNSTATTTIKIGKGLQNIKDRVALLNGKCTINTVNGFQVHIEIPL